MSAHSRFLSMTVLASVVMASSGCVCVTNNGRNGDIILTWNFDGNPCHLVPDVTQVRVVIPGQTLQNNGVYGCVNAGTAGIRLLDFRPGTYDYIITGEDARGVAMYDAAGKITVNGDVAFDVTLRANSNARGIARLYWVFPQGSNVDCRFISAVDISVNGALITSVACTDGLASAGPGVPITGITPGQNSFTLAARDANSFYYYRTDFTLGVYGGGEIADTRTLQWAVGSLPIRWTFSNGANSYDCAQAGVSTVFVNLIDSAGQLVYGGAGTEVNCFDGAFQGTVFPYLYGGNYGLVVQARDSANRVYSTNQVTPPVATVTPGQFPVLNSGTQIVLMTIQ